MEENNLMEAFTNLNINDKRNSYNEELLKLYELLKSGFELNMADNSNALYNYNRNTDSELSEGDYLIREYKNILLIRQLFIDYMIYTKNR